MNKQNKVLSNTIFLYTRQLFLIGVSLYSLNIVLDSLGVDDFGVYTVIASIVSLCVFVTSGLSSASQRFLSFAIGQKDSLLLRQTFSINLIIYISLSILLLFIFNTVGFWAISNFIDLPIDRKYSALRLYDLSIYTFIFNVLFVPFVSLLIAHEDMKSYTAISIVEGLIKLLSLFFLTFVDIDKLILYGYILLFNSIFVFFIYIFISVRKYDECQFKVFYWNQKLLYDIVFFTSWSLFGQLSTVFRIQIVTLLVNNFFSPSIVAARAISLSISSQVNVFSTKFNVAIYPSIIKSYAENNNREFFSLIFFGSKITFFLMWIFSLPLLFELKFILDFWLGTYPIELVYFSKLSIIESLILSIALPLTTAARAQGDMRAYELILGSMQMLIPIAVLFAFYFDDNPNLVFYISIFVNVCMFTVRLFLLESLVGLDVFLFFKIVILRICLVIIVSIPLSFIVEILLHSFDFMPELESISKLVFYFIISSGTVFFVGLDRDVRNKILLFLTKKING